MGIEINYPFGAGSETDPNSLHLDGGTMSVNATVLFPQTNGNDSEIGAWGFGVENTNGAYTTIEPNQIVQLAQVNETGDNATRTLTINTSGLNSISSSGDLDKNWSLSNDFVQGKTNSDTGWILSKSGVSGANNAGGWGLNNDIVYGEGWSFGTSGITFTDGTVQTTSASDWKAGGEMNLNSSITIKHNESVDSDFSGTTIEPKRIYLWYYEGEQHLEITPTNINCLNEDIIGNPEFSLHPLNGLEFIGNYGDNVYSKYQPSGITFPDNTVQTTAAVTPNLTPYLQKSDNLASLTSSSTARTNLGLAYATNAQSNAGTSASTVLTPSNSLWTSMSPAFHNAFANNTTTTNSSGNGGSQVSDAWGMRNFIGTTASSYSSIKNGATTGYSTSRGQTNGNLDWSKIIIFSGICLANQFVANSTCRAGFGVSNNHLNTDLLSKGIGYRIVGTGAVELQVHNGTTLYNVTSTFTPTANTAFDFVIYSDGVGNATLYINDNSVATSSNAPTGGSSNTYNHFFCETDISANVASQIIHGIGNPKIYIGR